MIQDYIKISNHNGNGRVLIKIYDGSSNRNIDEDAIMAIEETLRS